MEGEERMKKQEVKELREWKLSGDEEMRMKEGEKEWRKGKGRAFYRKEV